MVTICANTESNWSEMFTQLFNSLNGPGYFPLIDGTRCPYCEDKDKIPVVINNSLSTEIKKIPLQIICEEAGLFGSQVRDILKSKVQTDYIVEQFYMDILGKALALKQGNYFQAVPKYSDKFAKSTKPSPIPNDSTFEHPNPKVKFPPFQFSDPQIVRLAASQDLFQVRRINWNGATWNDWWSIDSYTRSTNSSMPWPQIDKRLYLPDKKINYARSDEKDEIIFPENNREVENICRIKDPYLVAVNAAIFGKEINSPQEGTEEYYRVAQEYALFGTTQQETGNPRPTKDENEPKINDCAKECLKQALPLQLNTRNTTSQKPKSSCPSMEQFIIAKTVLPLVGFPSNMNQAQQTILGVNIPQKSKVVPTQKYIPKVLTPQQIMLQNAIQKHRQAGGYGVQNIPNSCSQPQQLLYPNSVVAPGYLNACFNETHVNTSIIQQQQVNFYGTGPAYDMMIYAQMLQQTQTIISKNRNAARSVPDFQKSSFLPNLGSSLNPPRMNLPNLPQKSPAASDALLAPKIDDLLELRLPFDSESDDLDLNEKDSIRN